MITETQLRNEMRQLLPAVDLDKTTERMIREKLQDTLGEDLSAYKALIRVRLRIYTRAICVTLHKKCSGTSDVLSG
jgi:hypothetical protein